MGISAVCVLHWQTDRLSWGCSYTERQGSSTSTTHRYRVWHETFSSCRDRHTDCHETVCSYTGRQGSSTPTTHRYRVWHETFSSCRDRQTHRLSWDWSFTDRQATCPPTQEDVGLAQDFLLLQRQTVRDFSTFLVRLQCRTLEWFLERLPFTSTVIDQKIDCVSY